MNYEKIYKILMEIVGDQNNVLIDSTLKKKNDEIIEDMSKIKVPINKKTTIAYEILART